MRYLLDTCVVSDFAQGQAGVLARIKSVSPQDIAVSSVTEMEVAYGLRLNPSLSRRLKPVMDAFSARSWFCHTTGPPRMRPRKCGPP